MLNDPIKRNYLNKLPAFGFHILHQSWWSECSKVLCQFLDLGGLSLVCLLG